MTISKVVQPCWHQRKLHLLKSIKSIRHTSRRKQKDKKSGLTLMLILDQEEHPILRDASFQCIRLVRFQGKDMLTQKMFNGCMLKSITKIKFSLLTMVSHQMIAFKVILVTAGWSVPCQFLLQEMSSSQVVDKAWSTTTTWSSIKRLLPSYQKVYIHRSSISTERLASTSSGFSRTSLGYMLSLMKEFQSTWNQLIPKETNYRQDQSLVDADHHTNFGCLLSRKLMLKCMDAMKTWFQVMLMKESKSLQVCSQRRSLSGMNILESSLTRWSISTMVVPMDSGPSCSQEIKIAA